MTNNKCIHHYMHHIAKSNKDVLKSAVKIVTFNGKKICTMRNVQISSMRNQRL